MILHPTIKLNLFKHLARKYTINWSYPCEKETKLKTSKYIFFKQKSPF